METKEIRKALLFEKKNGCDKVSAEVLAAADAYSIGYKEYLDAGKTEREAAEAAVILAEKAGYVKFTPGMSVTPGAKIYHIAHQKFVFLAHIGARPIAEGINIAASHIDSPRLDLKPNPLYEDSDLAMFKTHYYGGIRKYQWMSIPLELRGVVCLPSGETVRVCIGDDPEDPVLVISDLLPHLGREQGAKPLNTAYTGESLNAVVGTMPYDDDDAGAKDRVKLAVLSILYDKYGFTEADFQSAELCLVPALRARDVGLDRSLIGAYGQDDRVSAYTSLTALLELSETPEKTAMCVLSDKEEIGSEGITGMKSAEFDYFVSLLCRAQGGELRDCFANSLCLSADVTAAYDPNFPDVYEKSNSAMLNGGVAICKYTGSGGKSGASDANAETMAKLRGALDGENVLWQTCELGKVDIGGGGTICKFMAERGIESVDAGTPLHAMHSPFEISSKLDVFMAAKASAAFFHMA